MKIAEPATDITNAGEAHCSRMEHNSKGVGRWQVGQLGLREFVYEAGST